MLTIDQLIEEYINVLCLDNWVEECKLMEIDVDLNSLLNKNIYPRRT
jgi:hypothetical protein